MYHGIMVPGVDADAAAVKIPAASRGDDCLGRGPSLPPCDRPPRRVLAPVAAGVVGDFPSPADLGGLNSKTRLNKKISVYFGGKPCETGPRQAGVIRLG